MVIYEDIWSLRIVQKKICKKGKCGRNKSNKFETDLFVKSSDRIPYLKPLSCHPKHFYRNIPYSLGYRLKRICSSLVNFEIRLKEIEIETLCSLPRILCALCYSLFYICLI